MFKNYSQDNILFISDLHLGDPRHSSIYDMDMDTYAHKVIDEINAQVTPEDLLILVGDIVCDIKYVGLLELINAGKILVISGNRESKDMRIGLALAVGGYGALSSIRLNNTLITHIPPHSSEAMKYEKVIHGHLHTDHIYNSRYYNVARSIRKGNVVSLSTILK